MPSNKNLSKQFVKNGFVLVNNLIKKDELKKISKRLEFLKRKQKIGRGLSEPGVKKSLVHSLHKDLILQNIIENKPWFNKINCELLNCKNVYTWNAKSNLKSRWAGSVEYYHQDYIYWKGYGFDSSKVLNCMVFVDNHSHHNAGLWLFPGSHKKIYKHEKFLNINSLQKYFIPVKILDKLNKHSSAISIKAKAGSCLFFHSKLVHGSSHNISPENRRILLYDISSSEDYHSAKKDKIKSFDRSARMHFEFKELSKRIALLKK